MMLYRIVGRVAMYPQGGKNFIEPVIGTTMGTMKKLMNQMARKYHKDKLEYNLRLEKVTTRDLSKDLLIQLLTTGDVELLLADKEILVSIHTPT